LHSNFYIMKKIYAVLGLAVLGYTAQAQVVPGGDMETWRTGTSHDGTYPTRTINAPAYWFGLDSTVIYEGEYIATSTFGLYANGNNFFPQVFPESTIVHGGAKSAKLITRKQDTLGVIGGSIANYHTNVSINLTSGTYNYFLFGGMPVTGRMHSVSAWVNYKYAAGTIADTAMLTATMQKHFGTVDSTIGTATVNIDSTAGSWVQVTGYFFYNDEVTTPDTMRITFLSSLSGSVDSSTLYVDDVTISAIGLGTSETLAPAEAINVFPNPAKGEVNIDTHTNQPLKLELYSVSGQVAATEVITGRKTLSVANMPAGLYFYNVYNTNGETVQKGKLEVLH
jgi:Secretion system C-terminal sorting domain